VEDFFVEPDAGGEVDPLDDEVDFVEALVGSPDIFAVETFQIEALQVLFFLAGFVRRIELGISQLFVEGVESLGFEEMVDPLTPFAAEVEGFALLFLGDHHRLVELQVAVGTGNTGQRDSSFGGFGVGPLPVSLLGRGGRIGEILS
jgi:hypothetical protein